MDGDRRSADLFITLDKVWPDGIPADGDVARIFLRKPGSPFSTVTIEDTGAAGARLDLLRDRRLVGADRPRRHLGRHRIAHHRLVAGLREPWRPDGPARCSRVRDQEAGNVLLHGRARDLRLPRVGDRSRRVVRPCRAARGPRRLRDTRASRVARLLDLRLRAAGPAPSHLLTPGTPDVSPRISQVPRTASSRPSIAMTGSLSGPISRGS